MAMASIRKVSATGSHESLALFWSKPGPKGSYGRYQATRISNVSQNKHPRSEKNRMSSITSPLNSYFFPCVGESRQFPTLAPANVSTMDEKFWWSLGWARPFNYISLYQTRFGWRSGTRKPQKSNLCWMEWGRLWERMLGSSVHLSQELMPCTLPSGGGS